MFGINFHVFAVVSVLRKYIIWHFVNIYVIIYFVCDSVEKTMQYTDYNVVSCSFKYICSLFFFTIWAHLKDRRENKYHCAIFYLIHVVFVFLKMNE